MESNDALSSVPSCYPRPIYPWGSFVICGCALGTLCALGLLGNLYAFISLINRYLGFSAFRFYLRALCVTDSCILFSAIFIMVIPILTDHMTTEGDVIAMVDHFVIAFYPVGMAAQTASAWLVVLMTSLRFLSLRFRVFTRFTTQAQSARMAVASTILLAILFNIPRAFELKLTMCVLVENNQTTQTLSMTSLRASFKYRIIYYVGAYCALVCVLPLMLLTICDGIIVCYLYRNVSDAETYPTARPHRRSRRSRLRLVSLLLASVAVVYLLCNAVPVATNIYQFYASEISDDTYSTLTDVGNVRVCLQASANCLIYLLFSRQFRQTRTLSYAETEKKQKSKSVKKANKEFNGLEVDDDGRYLRAPRKISSRVVVANGISHRHLCDDTTPEAESQVDNNCDKIE